MPGNPNDERTPADTEKSSNSTQPLETSSKGEGSAYSAVASGTTSEEDGTSGESLQSNESDGWTILNDGMKEFEEGMLEKWRNELDNLLVFAGLFSAVVTAFTIESYKWLQEDSSDTSAKLLANISLQLSSFIANPGFINSSFRVPPSSDHTSTQFTPDALSINVNTLWFTSLSLSLVAAFYTIAVQQWLRSFPIPSNLPVRPSVRFRQFRYEGLEQWHVPMIVSLLPILIQIAVVLFFAGLFLLLQSLNATVAIAFVVLSGIPLALFGFSIFVPLIWASCPYKSLILPTIWMLFMWCLRPFFAMSYQFVHLVYRLVLSIVEHHQKSQFTWRLRNTALHIMSTTIHWWFSLRLHYSAAGIGRFWDDRDRVAIASRHTKYDISSLSRVSNLLKEEHLINVTPCLSDFDLVSRMRVALDITVQSLGNFSQHDYKGYNDVAFINPTLLSRIDIEFARRTQDFLFSLLPDSDDIKASDWIAEESCVTSVLLLIERGISLEIKEGRSSPMTIPFSRRVRELYCSQEPDTPFSTSQGRFPPAILYRCCVEYGYTPDIDEQRELLRHTLTMLEQDYQYDIAVIEAILSSCTCALYLAVHSVGGWTAEDRVLSESGATTMADLVEDLADRTARFMSAAEREIRDVGKLSAASPESYTTPKAIRTLAGVLYELRTRTLLRPSELMETSIKNIQDTINMARSGCIKRTLNNLTKRRRSRKRS